MEQKLLLMTLSYIFHSSFLLETDTFVLLFDYWEDPLDIAGRRFLSSPKKKYILCSHVHHDHFNSLIFDWKKQYQDIQLILSDDIRSMEHAQNTDAVFMNPYESYQDDLLCVKTFGSTDEGLSFVLEAEEKSILHAGDLNNWHWQDEGDKAFTESMEKDFERKLSILRESYPSLDVAMFPVDIRLGSDYYRGAEQLVQSIRIATFVPMHFEPDYESAYAFEKVANKNGAAFFRIKNMGDQLNI